MERLEALAGKLNHVLPDIRIRAAANLNFKLQSGVVDRDLLGSSHCVSVLVTALHDALCSCIARLQAGYGGDNDFLRDLLNILQIVGHCEVKEKNATTLSQILSLLYDMSTNSALTTYSLHVSAAIDSICSVHADILNVAAGYFSGETAVENVTTDQSLISLSSDAPSRLGTVSTFSALRHSPSTARSRMKHGAGSIINSPLVAKGWRFPPFALTEADERYLFDAEVKLKMGQEGVHPLLLDIIADFPAQCLLTRTGLLSELLDVVGTPFLSSSTGPASPLDCPAVCHPVGCDSNGYMTPLSALDWLDRLLDKMKAEFSLQIEGSIVSGVGQRPVSSDEMSTAIRMAAVMQSFRYPQSSNIGTLDLPSNSDQGVSLAGAAFAISAAVLPLLRSREMYISCRALALLHKSLQMSVEPLWCVEEVDALDALTKAGVPDAVAIETQQTSIALCTERIQHFISRIDQLLACGDPLNRGEALKAIVVACNNTHSEDSLSELSSRGCELCLLQACAAVLALLPPKFECVSGTKTIIKVGSFPNFTFGSNIMDVMTELAAVTSTAANRSTYLEALEVVNPTAANSITEIHQFSNSLADISAVSKKAALLGSDWEEFTAFIRLGVSKAEECCGFLEKLHGAPAAYIDIIYDDLTSSFEEDICSLMLYCSQLSCTEDYDDGVVRLVDVLRRLLRIPPCNVADCRRRQLRICDSILNLFQSMKEVQRTSDLNTGRRFDCIISAMMIPNSNGEDPTFLHDLVVFGLLDTHGCSCESIWPSSQENLPLILVETMLTYQLNAYDDVNNTSNGSRPDERAVLLASHYSPVLSALKLFVWKSVSNDSETSLKVPKISQFIDALHAACAVVVDHFWPHDVLHERAVTSVRLHFEQSILMGLFHDSKSVRKESLLRAMHFYGIEIHSIMGYSRSRIADTDLTFLLNMLGVITTNQHTLKDESQNYEQMRASDISFADLWNLSRVAFGSTERSTQNNKIFEENNESSVQLAALRQLLAALRSSDNALLRAINDDVASSDKPSESWAAKNIIFIEDVLDEYSRRLDENNQSSHLSEYIVSSVTMLHWLLQVVPAFRRCVTYVEKPAVSVHALSNEPVFYLRSLLRIAFYDPGRLQDDTLFDIQLSCWRALFSWSCAWVTSGTCVAIPPFVSPFLKCIKGNNESFDFVPTQTLDKPVPPLPEREARSLAKSVAKYAQQRDLNTVLDALPSFLNYRMQTCQSHVKFDEWLVVVRCMIDLFPDIQCKLVTPVEGGLALSVNKILETVPNTSFDLTTFHHTLLLFCSLSTAVDWNPSITEEVIFAQKIVTFPFSAPMIEFIETILFPGCDYRSKNSAKLGTTPRSTSYKSYSEMALDALLDLMLRIASNFAISAESFIKNLLEGSPILVLIARLACTEAFPSAIRLKAWRILETLTSLFPDETLAPLEYTAEAYWGLASAAERELNMVDSGDNIMPPVRLAAQPFQKSLILNMLYDTSTSAYSALADIVSCARLLRSPDSLVGSSSAHGALKLIQTIHRIRYDGPGSDNSNQFLIGVNAISDGMPYPWLLRHIHDRCGIIRSLAVDIIETTFNTKSCLEKLFTDCNDEKIDRKSILPTPLSNMRHIVLDSSECVATRTAAMRILCNFFSALCRVMTTEQRESIVHKSEANASSAGYTCAYEMVLSTIICGLSFCLEESRSSYAIREGLTALEGILSGGITNLFSDILERLKPHKALVRAIAFIHPAAVPGISMAGFEQRLVSGYFNLSKQIQDVNPNVPQCAKSGSGRFYSTSYSNALTTLAKNRLEHAYVAQTKAIRICHRLLEIDNAMEISGASTSFFSDCMKQTNLIRNVVCVYASLGSGGEEDYLLFGIRSKACVDLLSAALLKEYSAGADSAYTAKFGLTFMIKGNYSLITNIVATTAGCLLRLAEDNLLMHQNELLEALDLLNSYLRLIALMLGSSEWRKGMYLGPSFRTTEFDKELTPFDPALSLLVALKNVHTALDSEFFENYAIIDIAYSRIEAVMGLLLSHSFKLRKSFEGQPDVNDSSSDVDSVRSGVDSMNKLSWCIPSLHLAMMKLTKPPVAPLKLLKAKVSRRIKGSTSVREANDIGTNISEDSLVSPPRRRLQKTADVKSPDSVARVDKTAPRTKSEKTGSSLNPSW